MQSATETQAAIFLADDGLPRWEVAVRGEVSLSSDGSEYLIGPRIEVVGVWVVGVNAERLYEERWFPPVSNSDVEKDGKLRREAVDALCDAARDAELALLRAEVAATTAAVEKAIASIDAAEAKLECKQCERCLGSGQLTSHGDFGEQQEDMCPDCEGEGYEGGEA